MDLSTIRLVAPYSVEGITNATIKEAYSYLKECKVVTIDTETATHPLYKTSGGSGLDPYTSMLISLQIGDDKRQYIIDTRWIAIGAIERILKSKSIVKLGVNIKFDYKMIKHHLGVQLENIYDIGLAELILHCGLQQSWSLKSLALKYLGLDLETPNNEFVSKDTVKLYESLEYEPLTLDLIKYSAADVFIPYQIYPIILKNIRDNQLSKVVKLENQFIEIAASWELRGFLLDPNKWLDLLHVNKRRLNEINFILNTYLIENKLDSFIGINWNSSKQVVDVFKELGIDTKIVDKEKSIGDDKVYKNSVGKLHITKFKDTFDIIELYLQYKQLYKAVTTYGFKFLSNVNPISRRIHTDVYQILNTGRISTSSVNLQNIPATKEFRACFVASPGYKLIQCDFSQQELRVLAEYSKDDVMLDIYKNNLDIHSYTSIKMFGDDGPENRKRSKIINFSIVYGASEHKLANDFQKPIALMKEWIDNFYLTYPKLKPYFEKQKDFAIKNGYHLIDTVYKRRSYLKNYDRYLELKQIIQDYKRSGSREKLPSIIWSEFFRLEGSYARDAANFRIQGSSGSMTKQAAILFQTALKQKGWDKRAFIVNLVHDEIVVECDEKIANTVSKLLNKCMLQAGRILVKEIPMSASTDISDFWKK